MNFVLSYDLSASGDRRSQIEQRINEILQPYPNTRKLSTFFIIHVNTRQDWIDILRNMENLSRGITESLHFIMSPLIDGGIYNGILRQTDWIDINNITNLDNNG